MKTSRYATSRKKACQQCSTAKARCDRYTGRCGRCTQRGLPCTYPQSGVTPGSPGKNNNVIDEGIQPIPFLASEAPLPSPGGLPSATRSMAGGQSVNAPSAGPLYTPGITTAKALQPAPVGASTGMSDRQEALDFSDLQLVCPINVDDISNRWLNPYIPVPGQTLKEYPPNITAFIYRILKSYAAVAAHGRGILPFIHPTQMTALPAVSPLTTCLSLVRIGSSPLPGSEATATSVLQHEMQDLYAQRNESNDETLLAAFQAYLIYTLVLFFRLGTACNNTMRGAMMNIQELACSSSRQGLVCSADQRRVRPRWEEWIIAETKRRTLFVMYLFDSILSTQEGLPIFLGTELQGLPAPANKLLWNAQSRYDWEREYNVHMAEWVEGGLTIDELWPIPSDLDELGIAKRRTRVDHWLENMDEFGTMIYAIMSCTHGG